MKRLSFVPAAACLAAGLLLASCAPRPAARLVGSVSSEPQLAPDFTLTDQHGDAYHLASSRGKVVVMSFIYTHCTDICPFITLKVKEAIALLDKDASRAVFVAVTTDPARDTVAVNAAYSRTAGLFDAWHFVTGSAADLAAVWKDFGIGVTVEDAKADDAAAGGTSAPGREVSPTQGLSSADLSVAAQMVDAFGGGYEISHTAPYWIIDPKGRLRVVMDPDVAPADIAANVRALLAGA